jgi:GT2 family glycosyltransferase
VAANDTHDATVVIPTWNGRHLLEDCLTALRAQTLQPAEIIVVDDGSTDDTAQHLAGRHPYVRVIKHDGNRGFAAAVNSGIRAATGSLIVLLNNDATPEPGWLRELTHAAAETPERVAMLTSKILRADDGRIDTTGDFLTVHGVPWSRGAGESDAGQYDNATDVFGACAGATAYRRELFSDVGLFDEGYFAYYEDVDLSARARRRGWEARYVPSAVVHHRVHATSGSRRGFFRYQTTRNQWYIAVKVLPLRSLLRLAPSFLAIQAVNCLGAIRHRELRSVLRAYRDVVTELPRLLRDRRSIRVGAVVDDATFARELVHVPLSEVLGLHRRRRR